MKLTEAVQFREPLFENFGDLENMIAKDIDQINFTTKFGVNAAWKKLANTLDVDPYIDFNSPKSIVKIFKITLKQPLSKRNLDDLLRETKGIDDRINILLQMLFEEMRELNEELNSPKRQEAEYEVIATGSNYRVYRLHNYSAARKFCNAFNTNHCTGSSDTKYFGAYEEVYGPHYAISVGRRLIYIISGSKGFVITSHDNESETGSHIRDRGDGIYGIVEDFKSNDMDYSESIEALQLALGENANSPAFMRLSKKMMKAFNGKRGFFR